MVYGQLFDKASDQELRSLKKLGMRWKVRWQQLPCASFDNNLHVFAGVREARKMGKQSPDNGCRTMASDAEDGRLDLRTTPVLVFGLDILGVTLGSARFVLAPFPFEPRVFQG